jgi:hypothetical protein
LADEPHAAMARPAVATRTATTTVLVRRLGPCRSK